MPSIMHSSDGVEEKQCCYAHCLMRHSDMMQRHVESKLKRMQLPLFLPSTPVIFLDLSQ